MKPLKMVLVAISAFVAMSGYAQNYMELIATLEGETENSKFGYTLATVDFNHDGYDDLVVGALSYPAQYAYQLELGKVYIYYGGPGFSSATQPSVTLEGTIDGENRVWIWSVDSIGDVNGDGHADLAIYEWVEVDRYLFFRVRVFCGGTPDLNGDPDYEFVSNGVVSYIRPLGDLNGDGCDEIGLIEKVAGIYRHHIIWGGSYTSQIIAEYPAGQIYMYHPCYLSGLGDINGDGYGDIALVERSNITPNTLQIRILFGSAQGLSDRSVLLPYPTIANAFLSPIGDFNGDGYSDFIGYMGSGGMAAWFGASVVNYAEPDVLFLLPTLSRTEELSEDISMSSSLTLPTERCPDTGDRGRTTGSVLFGDFNGDGYSDIVRAYRHDIYDGYGWAFQYAGFWVWLGNDNPNGIVDYSRIVYGTINSNYGEALTTGDFNGDGIDDIAISSSFTYWDGPTQQVRTNRGFVYVYAGNADLVGVGENLDPVQPSRMKVTISPNPCHATHGSVGIKIEADPKFSSHECRIGIYNIKGQKVYDAQDIRFSKGVAQLTLPVSHLASGVYLCRVTSDNDEVATRLTIIK